MLDWVLAIAGVVGVSLGIGFFQRWRRDQRRVRAAMPPMGEEVLRSEDGLPTRLFVDRDLPTGAKAGLVNLTTTSLVLTEDRLIVATHHGRVMEATPAKPVSVRCVGPRRLVCEGMHPDGGTQARAELLVDDPEGWVRSYQAVCEGEGEPSGDREALRQREA